MNLWRVYYHDNDEGTCYEWHPTKASAEAACRLIRTQQAEAEAAGKFQIVNAKVESVEIPTNKRGLLLWLNSQFIRDNG